MHWSLWEIFWLEGRTREGPVSWMLIWRVFCLGTCLLMSVIWKDKQFHIPFCENSFSKFHISHFVLKKLHHGHQYFIVRAQFSKISYILIQILGLKMIKHDEIASSDMFTLLKCISSRLVLIAVPFLHCLPKGLLQ